MPKFLANIDLAGNELLKARIENSATAPTNPGVGQVYFNTTTKRIMQWDGTSWSSIGAVDDVQVNGTSVMDGDVAKINNIPASIISGELADEHIASADTWNQAVSDLADEIERAKGAEDDLEEAIGNEVTRATGAEEALDERIDAIEAVIPTEATSTNQLADKDFVNSSIATNTADFKGTYDVVADLELTISATHEQIAAALKTKTASKNPDNNDYAFVTFPDATVSTQVTKIERYKYTDSDSAWHYEFVLNNSSFTANQWAAINSGITSALVTQITDNQTAISELSTSLENEVTRAQEAEGELEDAIDAEVTRATNAENALDTRIDNIELKDFKKVNGVLEAGSVEKTVFSQELQVQTGDPKAYIRIYSIEAWDSVTGEKVMIDSEIKHTETATSNVNAINVSISKAVTNNINISVIFECYTA